MTRPLEYQFFHPSRFADADRGGWVPTRRNMWDCLSRWGLGRSGEYKILMERPMPLTSMLWWWLKKVWRELRSPKQNEIPVGTRCPDEEDANSQETMATAAKAWREGRA